MAKLTEYHNGVAVIKDKRFKEAAEKLAKIEDGLELIDDDIKFYKVLSENAEKCGETDLVVNGIISGLYRAKSNLLKGGGSDE